MPSPGVLGEGRSLAGGLQLEEGVLGGSRTGPGPTPWYLT
jgi:hypothetical protein